MYEDIHTHAHTHIISGNVHQPDTLNMLAFFARSVNLEEDEVLVSFDVPVHQGTH